MSNFIPPATIEITGDSREFARVVGEVKAMLADLAKQVAEPRIGGDTRPLQERVAATKAELSGLSREVAQPKISADPARFVTMVADVRAELLSLARDVTDAKLGANAAPFWADIAALREEVNAMSPLDLRVDANTAAALAKIAAIRAALGGMQLDALIGAGLGSAAGGGGGAAGLAGLLGALGGGGGGGAADATILGALGWKQGKGFGGFLRGMAGFGSVLGLAGFGAEHVIGSAIGVGGSMIGGLLGGGLLGLGALGTMGVGMGTDMAGMGQAAGDIRNVVQAQNQLSQAIAVYGRNSYQAAQAQANLNYVLSDFSPIARGAILSAANTAQAFKVLFDQLTGPAEKVGAQIIQQAVQVGEKFLPTVGKYAAENMGIIKRDIQPFFSWLTSTSTASLHLPGIKGSTTVGTSGLSIFQNLEQVFQRQLPTAIKAATGAFELFGKVVGVAAQYTGGFMRAVADIVGKLNRPSEFVAVADEVGKLIGLFHSWLDLLGSVAKVIAEVFRPAVGFGQALANYLRNLFDQLAKFLSLKGTQSALHSLFTAHLVEVIKGIGGAISDLLPVAEGMFLAFIKVAGAVSRVTGDLIVLVAKGLKVLLNNPVAKTLGAWAVAALLVGKGIGSLYTAGGRLLTALTALPGRIRSVVSSMTAMAARAVTLLASLGSWAAGMVGVSVESEALNAALGVGVIAGIAALAFGIYELVTHWKTVWSTIKRVAADVWGWLKQGVASLRADLDHGWHAILSGVETAWNAIRDFLHSTIGQILLVVLSPIAGLVNLVAQHWNTIRADTVTAWHAVVAFLETAGRDIINAFKGAGTWLLKAGVHIVDGLLSGIKSAWGKVTGFISRGAHDVSSFFGKVLGIFSPSTVFAEHGKNIDLGLIQGLEQGLAGIIAEERRIAERSIEVLRSYQADYVQAGLAISEDVAAGIRSGSGAIGAALRAAVQSAVANASIGGGVVAQLRGGTAW